MAQAFCHVCYGTSLTFENGVLVCDACGTQTQTYQEETEFQQGIDDTRGRRKAAGSNAASQQLSQAAVIAQQEVEAAKQLKDAALVYARCLQHLLKVQAQALSSRFGVAPEISSLLRQMWLSHIPTTGILEPKPQRALGGPGLAHAAAATVEGQSAGNDDSDNEGEQQQQTGHKMASMRAAQLVQPHMMKALFWKLLHPQVTLQLCFLGCVLLREAITFFDIMLWALDGQLPFLELPHLSMQAASGDDLSCLPVRCLQAQLAKAPLAFCTGCCQLADKLGVQLPPIAAEALLMRSVKEIGLPEIVYDTALQLYLMYLINTEELQLTPLMKHSHRHVYTWLAAVILIAMKLLYGLASAAGGLMPVVAKVPGPPGGWQHWAQQVLDRLPGMSHLPLSEQEALQLSPEQTRQYIQFCRRYMFAGQPIVSTMNDVHRLLTGWYDAAAPARGRKSQPPHQQQQQSGVLGVCYDSSQKQQQEPQQLQQQLQGAINPQQCGLNNYSLTILGSGATKGYQPPATARLQPDLAAVIVAIAGYARTSPGMLIDCVRKLEKQMVAVESGVKVLDRLQQVQAAAQEVS